jgi:hypothetical protein
MPSGLRQRKPLVVRDRDEGCVRKTPDDINQSRQIKAPVHSRKEGHAEPGQQRQMQPIDVGVDRIELLRMPRYRFQQGSHCRHRVGTGAPEAQRTWPDGVKLATCVGVPTREQGDVVAQFDQLIHQPRDDALCAAVEFGRNAFGQRGYLSNPHDVLCLTALAETGVGAQMFRRAWSKSYRQRLMRRVRETSSRIWWRDVVTSPW